MIYQWLVLSLLTLHLDLLHILHLLEDIHLAIEVDINFVAIEEEDTEEMEGIAEEVDMEDSQGDMITDMIVIRAILLILTLVVKSVEVITIVLLIVGFVSI